MPDEGMTPQPGAPPSPAGGGVPGATPPGGQPPGGGQATGPNPATMPVANRGLEAQALAALSLTVQRMQTILAAMPAGSEMARDVRKAIDMVAKHVPPGAVSQGIQITQAQRDLMTARQNQPQIAAARAAHPAMPPSNAPPMSA